MSSQFRETIGKFPTERSVDQKGVQNSTRAAEEPAGYADHISYGIITDVNFADYQVKVKLFGDREHPALENEWQALVTQQDEIFLRWGQLRKGMHCRVYWRGQAEARKGFVEIVADEDASFTRQKDKKNEVDTMPYKFLGGGLTAF